LVVIGLILKVCRAKISSEENHEALVKNTRLLLNFLGIFTQNVRHSDPLLLRNIKRVVILQNNSIMPSEDDEFIPIVHHVMESPSLW
jgi:hypothetical protein